MPEVIQQGKYLFFTVEIMVVPGVDPELELLKLVLALRVRPPVGKLFGILLRHLLQENGCKSPQCLLRIKRKAVY